MHKFTKRKNPAAVALGRRGAKARNAKLTPDERSEIARKAGLAGGRGRAKNLDLEEYMRLKVGESPHPKC